MPNCKNAQKQERLKNEVAPFFNYMRRYGMTLTSLAEKLHISVQRISFYRLGQNQTPAWVIEQGYKAIGSPADLAPFVISFLTKRAEQQAESVRRKSMQKGA